jgi:hypothetical protein
MLYGRHLEIPILNRMETELTTEQFMRSVDIQWTESFTYQPLESPLTTLQLL